MIGLETPELGKGDLRDCITMLRVQGCDVDDDGDPSPENIPVVDDAECDVVMGSGMCDEVQVEVCGEEGDVLCSSMYKEWNSTPNIYNRRASGLMSEKAQLTQDVCSCGNRASFLDYFIYLSIYVYFVVFILCLVRPIRGMFDSDLRYALYCG